MNRFLLLTTLAWIGIIVGPTLFFIRGDGASAFEKFCYVTMIGPLAVLAVSVRYAVDRRNILQEPDSTVRVAKLKDRKVAYRILIIILLMAMCVSMSTAAWLLGLVHGY